MVENTQIEISTNLKNDLEKKAKANNTDIDNIIKLVMIENEDLKKNPSNYYDKTLISAKDNKNKKGEVTSTSYSTAIPKPILNKLGLQKGQVLYWDIDQYKIIITPELIPKATPEEESIQAGYDIFQDMLFNNKTAMYTAPLRDIKKELEIPETEKTKEEKVNSLVELYKKQYRSKYRQGNVTDNKKGFKQILTFLLDYPLDLPDQYEIVQEVYDKIIEYEKTLWH